MGQHRRRRRPDAAVPRRRLRRRRVDPGLRVRRGHPAGLRGTAPRAADGRTCPRPGHRLGLRGVARRRSGAASPRDGRMGGAPRPSPSAGRCPGIPSRRFPGDRAAPDPLVQSDLRAEHLQRADHGDDRAVRDRSAGSDGRSSTPGWPTCGSAGRTTATCSASTGTASSRSPSSRRISIGCNAAGPVAPPRSAETEETPSRPRSTASIPLHPVVPEAPDREPGSMGPSEKGGRRSGRRRVPPQELPDATRTVTGLAGVGGASGHIADSERAGYCVPGHWFVPGRRT